MTGKDVFLKAMFLLNYTDVNGDVDERQCGELFKRAPFVINQVLADVCHVMGSKIVQIGGLNELLPVPEDVAVRVMPYGVAMHIATSENDGDSQQLMAAQYNALRGSIPRESGKRVDVLPRVVL